MASRIQISPEQAARELGDASDFAWRYNLAHTDTVMYVQPLPNGNVQVIISKVDESESDRAFRANEEFYRDFPKP